MLILPVCNQPTSESNMAIVVIPKTEAECNQVRSVLHSHNRNLWCTSKDGGVIKVGKVVICWGGKDKDYVVRPVHDPVLDIKSEENVPANALYERLYRI